MPGYPRYATRVWDAILAMELPLDVPLAVAPAYWQQFMLHRGTAPSIANLYIETTLCFGLAWKRLQQCMYKDVF